MYNICLGDLFAILLSARFNQPVHCIVTVQGFEVQGNDLIPSSSSTG